MAGKKEQGPARFVIGDYVVARAAVAFGYEDKDDKDHRIAVREEREVRGWVVGMAHRREGQYEGASGTDWVWGYEDDPAYLNVTQTRRVWKVAASLTTAPVEVLDEDMPAAPSEPPGRCPVRVMAWPDEWRKIASEQSKDWPRDKRGRFIRNAPPGFATAPAPSLSKPKAGSETESHAEAATKESA